VDVLTSAAVNACDIRCGLEKAETLRIERLEMEIWKRKREERKRQNNRAMAVRHRLRDEAMREKERASSEKEKVEVEKPEEIQENTSDNPGLGCGSDSQLNCTEENTESEAPSEEPTLSLPTYALALKSAEIQIQQTMYDRISRILYLFQLHQTSHLILGSFGTGDSKNRTDLIATIFADLLIKPGGRFKDVFQTIVFAILGKETVRVFSKVFFRADKRAQGERTGKTSVFMDTFGIGSDQDVKEGDEEKRMRMMKWKARRSELERRNPFLDGCADAAS